MSALIAISVSIGNLRPSQSILLTEYPCFVSQTALGLSSIPINQWHKQALSCVDRNRMSSKPVKRKSASKRGIATLAPERQKSAGKRIRLDPELRRAQILKKAIRYFSEAGFGGNTRELSRQLGMSQSLLYHYFESKNELLQAIGKELYERPWREQWDQILSNRSKPLKERLITFYTSYAAVNQTREVARIFVFAGLHGISMTETSLNYVRRQIYPRLIEELRYENRMPSLAESPMTSRESEIAWQIHSTIFYLALRRDVFSFSNDLSFAESVEMSISVFVEGAVKTLHMLNSDDNVVSGKSPAEN